MNKPNTPQQIRNNPIIINFLANNSKRVANSYNDEQLISILTAINAKSSKKHVIDQRGTFKVPFYKWHFYYVFLLGRNQRELSRKEKTLSMISVSILTALFFMLTSLFGLLLLYLVKSALGIDLFPNFSLGIWGWFKNLIN